MFHPDDPLYFMLTDFEQSDVSNEDLYDNLIDSNCYE